MTAQQPLTDLAFNILVALADEDLHGYGLIKRLREQEGRGNLRTGTVYAALARLQEEGLVTEAAAPSDAADGRRRYYRLTAEGRAAARAEAGRLARLVGLARSKDLLPEGPGA